ncbi:MAG: hypothetical protein M1561_01970 [Gammaproteobacteria bacterium]|nr:hypothetical protein [Gammaproteobacteria bacterium]
MKNLPNIKKIPWSEARKQLQVVNPELAEIIDRLGVSDKKYPLYEASYPYGCQSVRKGKLYLPNNEGKLVSLLDGSLSSSLAQDLSYNLGTNPVCVILTNAIEVYITTERHTIPAALVPAGSVFSTWVILDGQNNHQPAFLWNISAGARSIFSLPKLSVYKKLEKLKEYFDLDIDAPTHLLNHGELFQAIASSPKFNSEWRVKILYFSGKWFENLHDKAWAEFGNYFFRASWKSSGFRRCEFVWKCAYSLIQRYSHLKPDPLLVDIVEHLLAMAIGVYPGFAPAIDNFVAPVSEFQGILTDIYKLEKYAPIIMQPTYFTPSNNRPIYYSLGYSTAFNFSPKARQLATKRSDLVNIIHIQNKYLNVLAEDKLNTKNTPIGNIPDLIQYDYFHNNPYLSAGIRDSKEIPLEDPTFMQCADANMHFPANSPFCRGCIRIARKK